MLIGTDGARVMDRPLRERRAALAAFAADVARANAGVDGAPAVADRLLLSACTRELARARRWLTGMRAGTDGVVAKRLDEPYAPGERTMVKVKHLRSADCVVGGFRYATGARVVGSLLLGLYDDAGKLHHVGFTTVAPALRAALTPRLEALRAAPGFTGRAPGGPSRWSTERSGEWEPLEPELVAEVRFDHVSGGRFRHGTRFLRWRPDKAPRQCTFEQIEKRAKGRARSDVDAIEP
jgi:ATP-dependent DNA ligase